MKDFPRYFGNRKFQPHYFTTQRTGIYQNYFVHGPASNAFQVSSKLKTMHYTASGIITPIGVMIPEAV